MLGSDDTSASSSEGLGDSVQQGSLSPLRTSGKSKQKKRRRVSKILAGDGPSVDETRIVLCGVVFKFMCLVAPRKNAFQRIPTHASSPTLAEEGKSKGRSFSPLRLEQAI